jgi:hypothetical protein
VKLGSPEFGKTVQRQRQQSLRMVADEVLNATGRPCPRCDMVCPTCQSTACDCQCAPTCEHAPLNMTSDNEFPIEDKIAPLVYAFHQLHQCPPCWSCERTAEGSDVTAVSAFRQLLHFRGGLEAICLRNKSCFWEKRRKLPISISSCA